MFLPKMPCSRNRGQPLHRGRISNGGLWVSAPPPFPPCAWEKPRYPPDRGRPRRAFSARPRSRPYRRRSRWSVGGKQQLAAISTFVREYRQQNQLASSAVSTIWAESSSQNNSAAHSASGKETPHMQHLHPFTSSSVVWQISQNALQENNQYMKQSSRLRDGGGCF